MGMSQLVEILEWPILATQCHGAAPCVHCGHCHQSMGAVQGSYPGAPLTVADLIILIATHAQQCHCAPPRRRAQPTPRPSRLN